MLATTRNIQNLLLPTGLPAPRLRQTRGRIANDYTTDPLARLTGTWLLNSAEQTLNYHGYEHNLRNDITRHTRTDASFVDYDYDDLGQLTDAVGSGSGVREAPREGGGVLECGDGAGRIRRFPSAWGADALDERPGRRAKAVEGWSPPCTLHGLSCAKRTVQEELEAEEELGSYADRAASSRLSIGWTKSRPNSLWISET
jgi:YD repeat-containing protein